MRDPNTTKRQIGHRRHLPFVVTILALASGSVLADDPPVILSDGPVEAADVQPLRCGPFASHPHIPRLWGER